MVDYRNVPVCAGSIPQWKNSRFLVVEDPTRVRGKCRSKGGSGNYRGKIPRVCGENTAEGMTGRPGGGTQFQCGKRNPNPEDIPAYAGKTWDRQRQGHSRQEHPRARGENARPAKAEGLTRNIPAHAGKTVNKPRDSTGRNGTSPRMRGKRGNLKLRLPTKGNIPAHAGKTADFDFDAEDMQEHPRARGENVVVEKQLLPVVGTSPRTRGKLIAESLCAPEIRNIPAHAGKTQAPPRGWLPSGEHPRARGENRVGMLRRRNIYGTSPRTRGKPDQARPATPVGWNIPAHAGKTMGA